jgi:hypothetical protein
MSNAETKKINIKWHSAKQAQNNIINTAQTNEDS